jgi:hypothetical protein
VAFGESTGGFPGIGELVGVRVGAENLDGNGAKVVEHLDVGRARLAMRGHDSGPEAIAGVMAKLDGREAEACCLAEKFIPLLHPVRVPAGGKGEFPHRLIFLKKRERGDGKAKSAKGRVQKGRLGV